MMTERGGSRRGWTVLVAALTLVVCASAGLGAGTLTRSLAGRSTPTGVATSARASARQPTDTPPAPPATSAPASTVAAPTGFTLTVTVTPNQVSVGERFTVVATVVNQDGVSRMQGVECWMRAPSNGQPPLFGQWPSSVVTDADGLATWSLLAPQAQVGRYAVEVVAYGQHQYSFWGDASVTLVAGTSGG